MAKYEIFDSATPGIIEIGEKFRFFLKKRNLVFNCFNSKFLVNLELTIEDISAGWIPRRTHVSRFKKFVFEFKEKS